jgi:hypothetical protein
MSWKSECAVIERQKWNGIEFCEKSYRPQSFSSSFSPKSKDKFHFSDLRILCDIIVDSVFRFALDCPA